MDRETKKAIKNAKKLESEHLVTDNELEAQEKQFLKEGKRLKKFIVK